MDTLRLRVTAPYGTPQVVNGIPTANRSEVCTVVHGVVNDPYEPESGDDTVDDLIDAFQSEHRCKVSYPDGAIDGVREFEIFEPAFPTADAAHAAAASLSSRLADYVQGRPSVQMMDR